VRALFNALFDMTVRDIAAIYRLTTSVFPARGFHIAQLAAADVGYLDALTINILYCTHHPTTERTARRSYV
jgi:hypothetical protein